MSPTTETPSGAALSAEIALYLDDVRAFIRRRSNADAADDITADVLLAAVRHHNSGGSLTLPWLFGVARNKIADHWRTNGRRGRLTDRWCDEPRQLHEPSAEELHLESELPELDRLSIRNRTLVERHYIDGQPLHVLAAAENVSYRAIESALARARRQLRDGDYSTST